MDRAVCISRVVAILATLGSPLGAASGLPADCPPGTVQTIAGGGIGDGGPGIGGRLMVPESVAVGPDGSVYIADLTDNRVRRVTPEGIITTVAGTGEQGFSGDGGPATAARLHSPMAVVAGPRGIYIADWANRCVRLVDQDGNIRTFAGRGESRGERDGQLATAVALVYPSGLLIAPDGSVYIADSYDNTIHKVGPDGVLRTVVARTNESGADVGGASGLYCRKDGLCRPRAMAFAPDGALLVADSGSRRVVRVDPGGKIVTVAGDGEEGWRGDGGPALKAGLDRPSGLACAADGSLYIADTYNFRIRKVAPDGIISTAVGCAKWPCPASGSVATNTSLKQPEAVAVAPDGTLYIADTGNKRVLRVGPDGMATVLAGSDEWTYAGDGGPAREARLDEPTGVALGPDGSLYVADSANHRVREVDQAGIITTVAGVGKRGNSNEHDFRDGVPATDAVLRFPRRLAVADDGSIYASDLGDSRVRKIGPDGIITTIAGNGKRGYSGDGGPGTAASLSGPSGLAVGRDGTVFIADVGNHVVRRVDPAGVITTVAGDGWRNEKSGEGRLTGDGGQAAKASLNAPCGVALGADGSLYIADTGNHRIRKVSLQGIITTVAGQSKKGEFADGATALQAWLGYPEAVATGPDGDVYIANGTTVYRVDPHGVMTALAASGSGDNAGEGGPAVVAGLYCADIAVGADGALYIADVGNDRVRKVCATATPPNNGRP